MPAYVSRRESRVKQNKKTGKEAWVSSNIFPLRPPSNLSSLRGWDFTELLRNKLRFTWGWAEVLSMAHLVQIRYGTGWPDLSSSLCLHYEHLYSDGQRIRGSFFLANSIQPPMLWYTDENETACKEGRGLRPASGNRISGLGTQKPKTSTFVRLYPLIRPHEATLLPPSPQYPKVLYCIVPCRSPSSKEEKLIEVFPAWLVAVEIEYHAFYTFFTKRSSDLAQTQLNIGLWYVYFLHTIIGFFYTYYYP
jgi:hypothetical protein